MIEGILLGLFWKKVQIAFVACMVIIASLLSIYSMIFMDRDYEVSNGVINVYNKASIGLFGIVNRIFSIGQDVNKISVNN